LPSPAATPRSPAGLVEAAGSTHETIQGDGFVKRENSFFINPGLRFALNFKSGLQIVP
jgi:hypothetical protein